jgi:hypothetical protein
MKRAAKSIGVCLFLVLLCLSGCKSLGPTPPPGTPGFVNCSDTAIHQAALNLLPSIETALATANFEAAIAALVALDGGPLALAEAACAVQWVLSKAQQNLVATTTSSSPGDSIEAAKVANAKAWLAAHPVTFQ